MSVGLLFIIFFALLLIGLPIGATMGVAAMLPGLLDFWFPAAPDYIVRAFINGVNGFPLLAVPMFILSGNIMAKGKISEKLFNFFAYFIGSKTAGLPITVVVTCLFYGAISGSGPATTAAVGAMTIPILIKLGYDKVFSTALVAVAGGLGVIIPPSIPFIFYGQSSGASIGDMFKAGIVPGLLIGLCLMIYSYYYCKKVGEDREKIMAYTGELRDKGFVQLFKESFGALLTPVIILGSIYGGLASPTEAAVISVIYSIIISYFYYKTVTLKDLFDVFKESAGTYSTILFIIAAATGFARVLTFLKVPEIISTAITGTVSSKVVLLLAINVLLLLVGMVMDTTPAILILTPILLPLVKEYGVNTIHFGIMMVVTLAIGFVTPPMGVNLFVASSLTGIPILEIGRRAVPFIIAFLVALMFITFIPQISLILL